MLAIVSFLYAKFSIVLRPHRDLVFQQHQKQAKAGKSHQDIEDDVNSVFEDGNNLFSDQVIRRLHGIEEGSSRELVGLTVGGRAVKLGFVAKAESLVVTRCFTTLLKRADGMVKPQMAPNPRAKL